MSALAVSSFAGVAVKVQAKRATVCRASALVTKAGAYDEELMKNAVGGLEQSTLVGGAMGGRRNLVAAPQRAGSAFPL